MYFILITRFRFFFIELLAAVVSSVLIDCILLNKKMFDKVRTKIILQI